MVFGSGNVQFSLTELTEVFANISAVLISITTGCECHGTTFRSAESKLRINRSINAVLSRGMTTT